VTPKKTPNRRRWGPPKRRSKRAAKHMQEVDSKPILAQKQLEALQGSVDDRTTLE